MPRESNLARIRPIAERVAAGYGLEIFDVQLRRESVGLVLRIVLDRPYSADASALRPPDVAEEGVTIEDCQRVSQDVSAILDVEDAVDQKYTLEVSSPGLDRPLRHGDDYRRFTGRLAKILVGEAIDGQKHFEGRIAALDGDNVILDAGGARLRRIPLGGIVRARLVVEF